MVCNPKGKEVSKRLEGMCDLKNDQDINADCVEEKAFELVNESLTYNGDV
jgi:hypothetical protein